MIIGGEAVNPRLHLLMHHVVAERLLRDDPPEDWLAFDALLEHDIDAHEAQHAIGRRFVEQLIAEFGPPPAQRAAAAPRERARGDRRARERRKAQRAGRRRSRR